MSKASTRVRKRHLILFFISITCIVSTSYSQTIYTQTIITIDGGVVDSSQLKGKKALFIIAPVKVSDSVKLKQIAAFNSRYGDSVKLIGLMSYEDGFVDSNKASIKNMYQSKGINIILTQGLHTKKTLANQSSLLKWLTTASLNKRFDDDAQGVGQQFYINEVGKLYSVLVAQTPLLSPAVERNIERKL